MKLKNYIKNYTELTFLIILERLLPKSKSKKESKSLLLINTGEMGDLIISSILLENPDVFKGYDKIKFLIKEQFLELFSNYKGDVSFIGYSYKKYKYFFFYKYSFLMKLRKEEFHTAIHITPARGILNEEITHLSGAKEKIAINSFTEYLGSRLGNYFDKKYNLILAKNTINEYEKQYELIKFLKTKNNDISETVFNRNIVFGEINYANKKKDIVIAPLSSLMNKDWSSEYFTEIIGKLKKNNNIVLLGSRDQKALLEKLCEFDKDIKIFAGCLSLNQIPEILTKAKLFIGLDSGITHLALKLNVPLIAIIGGGEFGRFFPYRESDTVRYLYNKVNCFQCHWLCSQSEKFCMTEIKPKDVLSLVHEIIN